MKLVIGFLLGVRLAAGLNAAFAHHEPATQSDLEALEKKLTARVLDLETRIARGDSNTRHAV